MHDESGDAPSFLNLAQLEEDGAGFSCSFAPMTPDTIYRGHRYLVVGASRA